MLQASSRALPLVRGHIRLNGPAIPSSFRRSTHGSTSASLAFDEIPVKNPPIDFTASGPLVIVHGLFGSKQNWRSLAKRFHQTLHAPVYSLDLRNHGQSPHTEVMDYTSMANDIIEFCKERSLKHINLLGHSLGGKAVMAAALSPELPPEVLSKLILVDISPARGPMGDEARTYLKAMKEIEHKRVKSRKEADDDASIRQFLLTNLERFSPATSSHQKFRIPLDILDKAIDGIGDFPYEPDHRKWEGKTLFVKGSKSKYINRKNIPIAKEYFPNMEMITLEAGHWVHAEQPVEFVNRVSEFILQP
ncbi:hypothetical protein M407DRAFT_22146 [Tulasnella calospora MUT 4182]|uniref:AB hydrolase-1 domain-containing protein n=1 Tax=Tulasnella calospora MUT 4182 TaxID=1051891 RepID=A0A0C3QCZ3_9AGAM|nr:hypothetical protein M407DRAFT_22146 [Tulasnella calospora MUT 4182]